MYILIELPSVWVVAEVPTNPLLTSITGYVPTPEIGPTGRVPNPTLRISRNSSSNFTISLGFIDEIPESDKNVNPAPIVEVLFARVYDNGVYIKGYWVTPSTVINAFSSFFFISSLW